MIPLTGTWTTVLSVFIIVMDQCFFLFLDYCINHSLINFLCWFWWISVGLHLQIGFRLLQMNRCTLSLIGTPFIWLFNPSTCREEVRWEEHDVVNFRPVYCCGSLVTPMARYWPLRNVEQWELEYLKTQWFYGGLNAPSKRKMEPKQPFFVVSLPIV